MSTTALTDIQEIIERTLFEKIRQEVVDKGYLPDITLYTDDASGWASWETDIATIVTANGFAIEIFNGGTSESRGVKKVPRFVMNVGSFLPGALGGDPQRFFSDQGTDYTALVTPPQTTDFYVDVNLVAGSIAQLRIMNAILSLAIPRRGYHKFFNDPTRSFFVRNLDYYDADNEDDGIMEKVYGYQIPDCWDAEDVEFATGIAKMTEITLNTNVQKYMDGSWGHDSTPLVVT